MADNFNTAFANIAAFRSAADYQRFALDSRWVTADEFIQGLNRTYRAAPPAAGGLTKYQEEQLRAAYTAVLADPDRSNARWDTVT